MKGICLVLAFWLLAAGCTKPSIGGPGAVSYRAAPTRTGRICGPSYDVLFPALVSLLQANGWVIQQASKESGFVSALIPRSETERLFNQAIARGAFGLAYDQGGVTANLSATIVKQDVECHQVKILVYADGVPRPDIAERYYSALLTLPGASLVPREAPAPTAPPAP